MLFDPKWKLPETPADIKLEPWQEILLKAADVLEQRGWTRGKFSKSGRVCAQGAINLASGFNADGGGDVNPATANKASSQLLHYVRDNITYRSVSGLPHKPCSIPDWNDNLVKRRHEIAAAMRHAAINNG